MNDNCYRDYLSCNENTLVVLQLIVYQLTSDLIN